MGQRIDNTNNTRRINRDRLHIQRPEDTTNSQTSPLSQSAVRWQASALLQIGDARKRALFSSLSGATAGRATTLDSYLHLTLGRATTAYQTTYRAGLEAMRLKQPDAPANLFELNQRAWGAHDAVLNASGVKPSDAYGRSLPKTLEFLTNRADNADSFFKIDPRVIAERAQTNAPAGDYFVRVLNQRHITDPETAHLAFYKKPTAWVSLPEEVAGLKLNQNALLEASGFPASDVAAATPGEHVMFIGRRQDFAVFESARWDNLLRVAGDNPKFGEFPLAAPDFRAQVMGMNNSYADHLATMKAMNITDATEYARTLPAAQRDAFRARNLLDLELGANPLYGGEGYTVDANGRIGQREFFTSNQKVSASEQFALLPLRNQTSYESDLVTTTTKVPTPYDPPAVSGAHVRNGALMGGGVAVASTLYSTFDEVRNGRMSYGDAVQALPGQIASQAALGTGIGASASVIEGYATRGIALGANGASNFLSNVSENSGGVLSRFASRGSGIAGALAGEGTSTIGAIARRGLGGGVAGGIINGGISAYEQINLYREGKVSGSQAIGAVAGEASVGVGAGLAGAAAGAAIGSIVPVAGTAVGAVVGFGVGLAAGYLADKGLRGLGVDKAIAHGVTAMIDGGEKLAGQISDAGSSLVHSVSQSAVGQSLGHAAENVGNVLSGGASTLKSVFGW